MASWRDTRAFRVESMEPRRLMDAAGVGLSFDAASLASFFATFAVDGAGVVTNGALFELGDEGPDGPLDFGVASISTRTGGGLRFLPASGETPFEREVASEFRGELFSAGWFLGSNTAGTAREALFVVDRATEASAEDLAGFWQLHTLEFSETSAFVLGGTTTVSSSFIFTQLTGSPGVSPKIRTREIIEDEGAGEFVTQDNSRWFVSEDRSVVLYSDADFSADSSTFGADAGIGVMVRAFTDAEDADAVGLWRLAALGVGSLGREYLGGPQSDWLVSVEGDGTWAAVDLSDAESQIETSIKSGEWRRTGANLQLHEGELDAGGMVLNLTMADNGDNLVPVQVDDGGESDRVFGLATRVPPGVGLPGDDFDPGDPGDPDPISSRLAVHGLSPEGEPLIYDLRDPDDEWFVVNVLDEISGDVQQTAPTLDAVAWVDPLDDEVFAATSTSEGLFVYQRDEFGEWTARNLTEELVGAEAVAGSLIVFFDVEGLVYVGGLAEDGALVLYRNLQNPRNNGEERWSFLQVADQFLTPTGEVVPEFAGEVISYVTRWNGLNIAGLDAEGNVWAVWSGDGGSTWYSNNLSEITGASPLSSGLTAYLTSWDGINIAGLNADGELVVSWWVPQFVGEWRESNLTDIAEGPPLVGTSVTSYTAPWGGLNVVGLTAEGEVLIYWWSPEREDDGLTWTTSDLTGDLPAEIARPTSDLRSVVTGEDGGELNVFGAAADGDVIRLSFTVNRDSWELENVTDEAGPG